LHKTAGQYSHRSLKGKCLNQIRLSFTSFLTSFLLYVGQVYELQEATRAARTTRASTFFMVIALYRTKLKFFFTQTNLDGSKLAFGDYFAPLSEQVTSPDVAVIQPSKHLNTAILPHSSQIWRLYEGAGMYIGKVDDVNSADPAIR